MAVARVHQTYMRFKGLDFSSAGRVKNIFTVSKRFAPIIGISVVDLLSLLSYDPTSCYGQCFEIVESESDNIFCNRKTKHLTINIEAFRFL